jgi:hypothetical protein
MNYVRTAAISNTIKNNTQNKSKDNQKDKNKNFDMLNETYTLTCTHNQF